MLAGALFSLPVVTTLHFLPLPPVDLLKTVARYASGEKTAAIMCICLPCLARGAVAIPPREYRWQGDNLTLININVYSKPPVNIRARFDDRGDLSFMQRESDGEKQQLSNDQIDLYRYRADQIRQISDALRQGVVLRQGAGMRWNRP